MTEGQLKQACEEYLQIRKNQGDLIFLRLNSGNFFISNSDGSFKRRVRGCPKGTADLVVIANNARYDAPNKFYPIVKFLELKTATGKQSLEQREFAEQVIEQGCEYWIIRSLSELREVL